MSSFGIPSDTNLYAMLYSISNFAIASLSSPLILVFHRQKIGGIGIVLTQICHLKVKLLE